MKDVVSVCRGDAGAVCDIVNAQRQAQPAVGKKVIFILANKNQVSDGCIQWDLPLQGSLICLNNDAVLYKKRRAHELLQYFQGIR